MAGSKTFEGKPCPHGHTLRYSKRPHQCVACKKVHASRWRKANRKRHLGRPERVWLNRVKKRAREIGVEFSIEEEDMRIPETCPLLGIPILRTAEHNSPNLPSLDRIDPSKGYVKGNVRVISFLANAMKRDATKEQLLAFAENLPGYLKS